MPAIIDSAPDCVSSDPGTTAARVDDSADFILQNPYKTCQGFMTFGPGSTYGPDGQGANGAYYALTWIGIAFMIFVLIAWVLYENRRLLTYAAARARPGTGADQAAAEAQDSRLA
jgi:hypothetical protein